MDSYSRYYQVKTAIVFERLASAGTSVALAIPGEGMSPPAKVADARLRTDAAYNALLEQYEQVLAAGFHDAVIDNQINEVRTRWPLLTTFRSVVDAAMASGDFSAVGVHGGKLPQITAVALDMTRRSGALSEDIDIAKSITGLHALVMLNDAFLMEIMPGRYFFENKPLDAGAVTALMTSRALLIFYLNPMLENVPKDISDSYRAYIDGADNAFITGVRTALSSLTALEKPDPQGLQQWMKAVGGRKQVFDAVLSRMSEHVKTKAEEKLGRLWNETVLTAAVSACLALLSIGVLLSCISNIRYPLRKIVARMTALAEGDTQTPVPYDDRRDEIGEIAHALAYFRSAEIEKLQLQAAAESSRLTMERERVEAQRQAEAEAERRLNETTEALSDGLQRLADGDMRCEIDEQFALQFEGLRHNFNKSVSQLRDALRSVGGLAVEVDSGSAEISNASSNLAKRTENQAASLEETAAALEEITANVVATTKRTSDARGVAQAARSKADHSGHVVDAAVTAMNRIEQASHQINQIIGVIDEIAFQTNLLALNAGVEAARAGEAGKGFAVVAQEVRELAQRSAKAAKEIKQLISNSASAVQEGVKLVNETGQGLTDIGHLVVDINNHMDAIATAAHEQSSGLSEVNTAINQMDQATQQNAAMVEEMNAAGVGLATQSTELRTLLGQFQLGNDRHEALGRIADTMRRAERPVAQRSPDRFSAARKATG